MVKVVGDPSTETAVSQRSKVIPINENALRAETTQPDGKDGPVQDIVTPPSMAYALDRRKTAYTIEEHRTSTNNASEHHEWRYAPKRITREGYACVVAAVFSRIQ